MTRIVVTGAGGFIGRALTAALSCRPETVVVAADNNLRGSLETLAERPNIRKVYCDVRDMTGVDELCRGADIVFHLAAINGTRNFYEMPGEVLEVGVIGAHNVLKASVLHRVGRVVLLSSSEVYNEAEVIPTPEGVQLRIPDVFNPRFSYAGSKIASELMAVNYLRSSATEFVIVRPHNVYGPAMGFDHVVPEIVKKIYAATQRPVAGGRPTIEIEGTGEETRAFMFIEDAIKAIELCAFASASGEVYHIGTEEEVSIRGLVGEIARVVGKEVQVRAAGVRAGSTTRRCPDTSKLQRLGFVAGVPLEEGLRRTVRWYWEYFGKEGRWTS